MLRRPSLALAVLLLAAPSGCRHREDALEAVRARGSLLWGGDREGGAPYVYSDPGDPDRLIGFEVLLAGEIGRELGVEARFSQGPWDNLPGLLDAGKIDVILNGYELTPERAALMEPTDPYYLFDLQLLGRRGAEWPRSWEDLLRPPAGRKARLGALVLSAAHGYLQRRLGSQAEVVTYDGNTDAMREVETGKLDATLQDLPIVIALRDRYPGLEPIGPPVGRGQYVMYVRKGETRLRDGLNAALARVRRSGKLREIEEYRLWSEVQEGLEAAAGKGGGPAATVLRGWAVIASRGPILLRGALMTVFLSVASMPLAMVLGLAVALGRLYLPRPLRWPLTAWVEVLRGTPLMLQLYVVFFLLPEIGITLPALVAAVLGLAINYSAYEAEIYRAGLQAVPAGQMEAALALGMSRRLALRRIVIPQAVRMVIPPVTNDFIALFKDTSVASVITVMELTKEYNVQRSDTGATLELAALTALLYLLMSLPLSRLAARLEARLGAGGAAA